MKGVEDITATHDLNKKHGMSKTKLYSVYYAMRQRCESTYDKQYKWYGERGIKVCDEWLDFQSFYDWTMESGYKEGLTLDRINNNGNYEPSNCRWVDWKTQQNNRRSNHLIEYDGQTHTIAEWGDILNISPFLISCRLRRGWSEEKALISPTRPQLLTINGITKPLFEWAHQNGIKVNTLISRVKSGCLESELLKPPNPQYVRTGKRKSLKEE